MVSRFCRRNLIFYVVFATGKPDGACREAESIQFSNLKPQKPEVSLCCLDLQSRTCFEGSPPRVHRSRFLDDARIAVQPCKMNELAHYSCVCMPHESDSLHVPQFQACVIAKFGIFQ